MCNLYSMARNQEAIRRLFRAERDLTGNLPSLPAIFPDYLASIVRVSVQIPCYVLPDCTRVLAQRGLQLGLGLFEDESKTGAHRIAELMARLDEKLIYINNLVACIRHLNNKKIPDHWREASRILVNNSQTIVRLRETNQKRSAPADWPSSRRRRRLEEKMSEDRL